MVANPPAGVAAAQSGQLDLTYTPSIPMFNALSQGVPLKIVAAADGYSDEAMGKSDLTLVDDTALIVGKDSPITSVGELEGKTISVPARKAQLEVTISNAVKQAGGDPSKINWIVLDFSSAVQSLKQGRIDAAGLVAPFTSKAVAEGGKVVSSPGVEFFEKGAVGLYVAGECHGDQEGRTAQGLCPRHQQGQRLRERAPRRGPGGRRQADRHPAGGPEELGTDLLADRGPVRGHPARRHPPGRARVPAGRGEDR